MKQPTLDEMLTDYKETIVYKYIKIFGSQREAAKQLGVHRNTISAVMRGMRRKK